MDLFAKVSIRSLNVGDQFDLGDTHHLSRYFEVYEKRGGNVYFFPTDGLIGISNWFKYGDFVLSVSKNILYSYKYTAKDILVTPLINKRLVWNRQFFNRPETLISVEEYKLKYAGCNWIKTLEL